MRGKCDLCGAEGTVSKFFDPFARVWTWYCKSCALTFKLTNGELEIPCVMCGYCCTVAPCSHGSWDEERGRCTHLTDGDLCGIYDRISDDPMFGSGCSSSLGNTHRARKLHLSSSF